MIRLMKSTKHVRTRHDKSINQIINNNITQKHNPYLIKIKSVNKFKGLKKPHIGFELQMI